MEDNLHQNVYRTLGHAYNQVKKDLHDKLADNGITWPQFHALYHIDSKGIQVNELARELGCNASNITGLIDRMVENGWVYREHSEEDRRVWLIKLTDEGIALRGRMIPEHESNIKERMSVLNEQELEQLYVLLKKLINNVDKEQKS